MQIDLHHTGIYVLCRIAGMSSRNSQIVAYASQYVDDAVDGKGLLFKNGGVFKQTQTAHKLLDPHNCDVNENLDIWIPFHYLPQCLREDSGLDDSLVAAPDSKVLALLLDDIRCSSSVHVLYRLGIGLHCLADSFAHQDFKGIFDSYNDVRLVYGTEEKPKGTGRFSSRLLDKWSSGVAAIGHEAVLNNPDIPYADWGYTRGAETIRVSNLKERYLPGVRNIYDYLVYFLTKNPRFGSGIPGKQFEDCIDHFCELLSFKGTREQRHENWLHKIKLNFFGFPDFDEIDESLAYDENHWFYQAVEIQKAPMVKNTSSQKYQTYIFRKKEGFEESHWLRFMQAAAEHQFLIVHCLLPELDIIVG